MNVFVNFSDSTKTKIVSVFSCPQDPGEYPHQDRVEESDPRYIAFIEECPFLDLPIG